MYFLGLREESNGNINTNCNNLVISVTKNTQTGADAEGQEEGLCLRKSDNG